MSRPESAETEIRFHALTRDQLVAAAPSSTLIIPLGSTEQHGHHLPVMTDTAIIDGLAHRAALMAAREVPVLLAPTLPYGCSHHHVPFGGTLSLRTSTYVELLCDLVEGVTRQGFGSVVLLNGHGGNDAAMRVAVDRLTNEVRCGAHIAATSYWEATAEQNRARNWAPGHAGVFETSLMLSLRPELVAMDRLRPDAVPVTALGRPDLPGAKIGRPGLWEESDGLTDDAGAASTEVGSEIADEISEALAKFIMAFHRTVFCPVEPEQEQVVGDLANPD